MTNQVPVNLDYLAAKYAHKIIEEAGDVDNTVTKALGVLQENGVYACFLYLLAKEKENGRVVVDEMLKLLKDLKFDQSIPKPNDPQNVLKYISNTVTTNLERLLLAKETLEQMLIYARYGAKAREAYEQKQEQ